MWGIGKDRKEAVKISANPVRQTGVRQQGCNEKNEDRQTGSAWKIDGEEHRVFFKGTQQKVSMEKTSKGHPVHPLQMIELVILESITHQFSDPTKPF